MLDSERYSYALSSLNKQERFGARILSREDNKQALFEQQFITQRTLSRLDVNKFTNPNDLPGIEIPICHQKMIRPTNIFVSLIGSPNSGRTTALNTKSLSEGDFGRVAYEAMKGLNEGFIDFNLLTRIQILTANVWHSHTKDEIYFDWLLGLDNKSNIFFERDFVDLPFIRSNFLSGRIDAGVLKIAEENFYRQMVVHPTTPRVIINTLVSTSASLSHEKELKIHNVVEPNFLGILYEQNIRFHDEMIQLAESQTPPFNYLAVNMSNPNIDMNVKHLLESINVMIGSFT